MTLGKDIPLQMSIQPYTFSSGNRSALHSVSDLGHHQFHKTITSLEGRTYREVGRVIPRTVSSHSMNTMVKTSDTPPRSTVIGMIGRGKGIVDGELVGHVVQEVVGREETKVMIGWSDIQ